MSKIKVASQNVSCDRHSELLQESFGDGFKFSVRFRYLLNSIIAESPDVIGFNEIRHDDNIKLVEKALENANFEVKSFKNNGDKMSFSNLLAISKTSEWKLDKWQHSWVAIQDEMPTLADEFSTIEGDPHGRCAGIVYLKHKDPKHEKRVCIAVSHVVPFGEVKANQQNALFSLNTTNMKLTPPVPTLVIGDLNRFAEDDKQFQSQLLEYELKESVASKLIIPNIEDGKNLEFYEPNDIGTFTPWPVELKVHQLLIDQPLGESKLDVQIYSDCDLIQREETVNKAAMTRAPNQEIVAGRDRIRHMIDKNMASDHLAIIGTYLVQESKGKMWITKTQDMAIKKLNLIRKRI